MCEALDLLRTIWPVAWEHCTVPVRRDVERLLSSGGCCARAETNARCMGRCAAAAVSAPTSRIEVAGRG